jgi:hypothetical protein
MIRDFRKLWGLIEEYRCLHRLKGHTPQTRGQRLNGFIAELLQCWGISAQANVRGAGEIDVGFELNGRHYIAEAKWEDPPIATGPIAKLQKRLRQRLGGTSGLFISMSGYTPEAISDLKDGEQLRVLLLSKEHLEAMLSGFVPPDELLSRLIAKASFLGEGSVAVMNLFETPSIAELGVEFCHPSEIQPLIREAIPGFEAEVQVSSLPFGQMGVAELSRGRVLVTLAQGVFLLDLVEQTVTVESSFPNCSRNPVVGEDGAVYIVRKAGVARMSGGQLVFVGGGYCGNTCLFKGSGSDMWVFANGYPGSSAHISQLDDRLGDELRYEVNYPVATGMNAALIKENHFLIIGSGGIAVVGLDGSCDIVTREFANPMGLMQKTASRYIIASGDVELSQLDMVELSSRRIASFNLQGSVSEISESTSGGGYLFSHYSTAGGTKGVLIKWRLNGG